MRVYISGKITGLPIEAARAKFESATRQMHSIGHDVINPMALAHDHDGSWESYMKEDLASLMHCDAIYLLPDWHESKGANLEYSLAVILGIAVLFDLGKV